jgi:hypothetical protein
VTANLAEALAHLPYADNHIILWVDAICIDQENLQERAQQVALMAEIYASAERVLAWTGPSTRNSNVAMNLFHRIADSIDMDSTSFEIRPRESQWTRESSMAGMYFQLLLDLHFPLPWDGPESRAFEDFFGRPWFQRLWIRQEITLGADDALLLCGSSSIQWTKFRKAAIFINQKVKDPAHPRLRQWAARSALVADTALHRVSWLGQLLRQMQRAECADARDRIYGVLGILPTASQGIAERIRPDYTKDVARVYRDVVLADMDATRRADLLSECRPSSAADSTRPEWPSSWVPDWTVRRERDLAVTQQCADGQSAVAATVNGQQLSITGTLAATVTHVVPIVVESASSEPPGTQPPVVSLIKEVATRLDLSARYPPSKDKYTVLEALCYAFSGAHLADHLSDNMINASTASMARFKRLIKFALDFDVDDVSTHTPSDDAKADVLLCMGVMARACEERSLLITKEGHVGTGPVRTRPGDQICVMLGCMRPLVLRPGASAGVYKVVGPCSAHGLNWGEALLGPLPDDVSFVWNTSGPNGDVGPAFRHGDAGDETVQDARIDWALLRVDDERDAFVQRASADGGGEVALFRRPDVDYFAHKGVSLTVFNLV